MQIQENGAKNDPLLTGITSKVNHRVVCIKFYFQFLGCW